MIKNRVNKDGVLFLCICGIVAATVIIFEAIFSPVTVSGSSMYPSLTNGDILITGHIEKSNISYGDIIVFDDPEGSGKKLIKRVIAIPGDSLVFTDNLIIINGGERTTDVTSTGNYAGNVVVLSPDEFFVVGDNYLHSRDSRSFGPIEYSLINGRVKNSS